MKISFHKKYWAIGCLLLPLLSACGGGGDSSGVTPPPAGSSEMVVQVTGVGNVKSQPAGIDCSTGNCKALFATSTVVVLSATPGSGQSFEGWGGACSGASSVCSVTLSQTLSVTARFAAIAGNAGALYESAVFTASRADLQRQLNAQGAKGFNYFGPQVLSGAFFNFYAKDSNTTYTAEILDNATSGSALLAQLNAQGAKGFDYWGPETSGAIYIKESNASAASFEILPSPNTVGGFLSQANAQGDKGFLYVGPYTFGNIYRKSSTSNAKYVYRLELQTPTHDALLVQANAQGQQGYKFSGLEVFSGEPVGGFRNIYVKDTSQSSTFVWKNNPAVTTEAALVSQANTEGAAGYVYWFSVILGNAQREIYFKPGACTGPLCRSTNPL